ncbi:DUF4352 domain-containing protein [Candidatus Saccharibacteria bacterium]|nr:DUF4352 domain-containing protein [Candidatus Saccharibacteria bacterium]
MADKSKNWFVRHKILTGILVLVVLGIVVSAADGGTDTSNNQANNSGSDTSASESQPAATTAKIGQAARDGKFEFTVTAFKCGATTLGENEFLREEAQGQFCVMDLMVKNIGDESQTFFSSEQKVKNDQGQEFSNDDAAELAINNNDVWLNEINPGNTAKGRVVFDVPADAKIVTAELHDSSFSNGVEVSLQ